MMQHFLAFRDSPIIPLRRSPSCPRTAVTRDDLATLARSIVATFFGTFRAFDRKRVDEATDGAEIGKENRGSFWGMERRKRTALQEERGREEGASGLPSRKKKKLALPSDLDEAEKFDPPHPSIQCLQMCAAVLLVDSCSRRAMNVLGERLNATTVLSVRDTPIQYDT